MRALDAFVGKLKRGVQSRTIESSTNSVGQFFQFLQAGDNHDVSINQDTVYSITAAWRCIRILSETVARLPFTVYKRKANGDVEEAVTHPVTKLIKIAPSKLYRSFTWREAMMHHALNVGNGVSVILRDNSNRPAEMRLLPYGVGIQVYEDRVSDELYYKFSGIDKPYKSSDIFHILGPTKDGLLGINTIQAHAVTLGIDIGSAKYAKQLWKNGAMPGAVLEYPGNLSPTGQKNLRDSFQNEYGGAENAGKVITLESGVKLHQIGWSITDNKWPDMKSLTIQDISRIYGVPLFMLSQLDNSTYNNMGHLQISFLNDGLEPWLQRFRSETDYKLLKGGEEFYCDFDTSNITLGTLKDMAEAWQRIFNMGALSPDDVRRFLKKNSVPFGKRYYIQGNNYIPVDIVDDFVASKSANKNGNKEDEIDSPSITEKDV